jgi:hypothetical protein
MILSFRTNIGISLEAHLEKTPRSGSIEISG